MFLLAYEVECSWADGATNELPLFPAAVTEGAVVAPQLALRKLKGLDTRGRYQSMNFLEQGGLISHYNMLTLSMYMSLPKL